MKVGDDDNDDYCRIGRTRLTKLMMMMIKMKMMMKMTVAVGKSEARYSAWLTPSAPLLIVDLDCHHHLVS